jgi:uncharacterized protein (TIGR00369 family)
LADLGPPLNIDDPENRCFGCSPHNADGLQLRFHQSGETTVECRYTPAPHICGAPEVVHGGVQAVILDETMGYAVRLALGGNRQIVTAELSLRYRRPVAMAGELHARAEVVRVDGDDLYLQGWILGPDGETLTQAEARWKVVG